MIRIAGNVMKTEQILNGYNPGDLGRRMIAALDSSENTYSYSSLEQLKFEVDMRNNIVKASIALSRSRFSFKVFKKSKCNPAFWNRTPEGGFRIKQGVMPYEAINDIFNNSNKYGTECATAIVIVFCKALVDIYPPDLSNQALKGIYLMNWQHLNPNLGIEYIRHVGDFFPGDCRYFKNPDVDPETPEWQGENTIDLGNGNYYGHGIGIASAKSIIRELNRQRVPGSTTSAYLMDSVTRPDFKSLYEGL